MSNADRESSEAVVERLRSELECLQCGYSLRGLPGDIMCCPECGLEHDVALLLSRRWTRPWHKAPGFNRLLLPLVWLVVGGITWCGLFIADTVNIESPHHLVSLSGATAVIVIWLWLLWRSGRSLRIASGRWYAFLAHVIFGGYLFAVWLLLAGLATAVFGGGPRLVSLMIAAAIWGLAIVIFWLGRRGEKHIASVCIRQHLLGR